MMFFQHSSAKDSSRRALAMREYQRRNSCRIPEAPGQGRTREGQGQPPLALALPPVGWLSAACGWLSACGGPSAGLWLRERCGQSCTPPAARESPAPSPGRSPDTPESQPSACQSTQSDRLCATANQPVGSTPSNTLLLGTCSPIGQSSRNRGCTTGPAPRQA